MTRLLLAALLAAIASSFDEHNLYVNWQGLSFTDTTVVSLNVAFGAAAVPEPGTWAMMLLGFGAVGFSMRRRRRPALVQIA